MYSLSGAVVPQGREHGQHLPCSPPWRDTMIKCWQTIHVPTVRKRSSTSQRTGICVLLIFRRSLSAVRPSLLGDLAVSGTKRGEEAEQLSCHGDPAELRGQRGWKCKHREVGCRWRAGCSSHRWPCWHRHLPQPQEPGLALHLEKQTAGERLCLKQSKLLCWVNVSHKSQGLHWHQHSWPSARLLSQDLCF